MIFTKLVIDLLCGLLVLVAGIVYLKNTFKTIQDLDETKTDAKQFRKEFYFADFIRYLSIAVIVMFIMVWAIDKEVNIALNIVFPSMLIAGAVKGFHYLFKNKLTGPRYIY